jgi:hypothetical protein
MKSSVKYVLAGAAGYALHSVINRGKKEEAKVYTPMPVDQGKLSYKIMDTVTSHLVEKIVGGSDKIWPSTNTSYSGGRK